MKYFPIRFIFLPIVVATITASFLTDRSAAQETRLARINDSNPIKHEPVYVGFEAATTVNYLIGSFDGARGDSANNGGGNGQMIAALVEIPLTHLYSVGLQLGQRVQSLQVLSTIGSPYHANLQTKYVSILAQMQAGFKPGLDFTCGFDLSVLTNSSITPEGASNSHAIPGIRSLSFGIVSSIGYNICVGPIVIAPSAIGDLPLTTLRGPNALDWRIASLDWTLAIKYGI